MTNGGVRPSARRGAAPRFIVAELRAGRPVEFVARGGSMRPAVMDGARVRVVPCAGAALGEGELCAFEREGAVVVHRVVTRSLSWLRTQGDALGKDDGVVQFADVLGRAEVVAPPSVDARSVARRAVGRAVTLLLRPAVAAAVAQARVQRAATRALGAVERGTGAFLDAALDDDELGALGVRLYDAAYARTIGSRELFSWERAWLTRRLPAAAGQRLLVAAAGDGREAAALVRAGYVVDAFEPASRALTGLRAAVTPGGDAWCASYADLVRAVAGGGGPLAALAGRRYAAVLLGWGSITHVLGADARAAVVRAADALAPDGPIFASMWLDGAAAATDGRAARVGRSVGGAIMRARRGGTARGAAEMRRFSFHCGAGVFVAPTEVESWGGMLGRELAWEGTPGLYPHATLLPVGNG